MTVRKPHFLLYCDASLSAARNASEANVARCKWRCVVDGLNEQTRMEIADSESDSSPDRSALVAVVRGLEALEQPSQVTLITSSPYVNKGMRYGLKEWRESDYKWEHFGTEKPIRNADLWRRVDQAMQFHAVECRLIESSNPMFQAESVHIEHQDRKLRIDSSHDVHSIDEINIETQQPKRRLLKKAVLSAVNCSGAILGGILRIPEQTVYAMESIFDRTASALQQCFAFQSPFHRVASRG